MGLSARYRRGYVRRQRDDLDQSGHRFLLTELESEYALRSHTRAFVSLVTIDVPRAFCAIASPRADQKKRRRASMHRSPVGRGRPRTGQRLTGRSTFASIFVDCLGP